MSLHAIDTSAADYIPAPITGAEAGAMFRAVVTLFRHWQVTDDQAATLLGHEGLPSFHLRPSSMATRPRFRRLETVTVGDDLRMRFRPQYSEN